ncbi:MAG TPA: hypothetical protein EYQ02_00310 [Microbacterium sp.]|nr:hypothetical protein [Microbacterium sp.]
MITLPFPDPRARARIGVDLGTNLLVEAGAGSDKTTELVSLEGLFALSREGHLGAMPSEGVGCLGRLLAVSMDSGDGSCGDIVRRLRLIDEIF